MFILGAGMAGCLAGVMNGGATILEAAPSLPNNHHGVLRFRTDNISKITGIPFKKVRVRKAVWMNGVEYTSAPPRLANLYSRKVVGKIQERSILNLGDAERWVAPEDFHEQLGAMLAERIKFNQRVEGITKDRINFETGAYTWARGSNPEPIVSTLPMPVMAKCIGMVFMPLLDEHAKEIEPTPVYIGKLRIPGANVHQTIYYPDNAFNLYRASIVGDLLIIESLSPSLSQLELNNVIWSFGLEAGRQCYTNLNDLNDMDKEAGKFSPIDDAARKSFMLRLSTELNIWSLGRYACWRPSVLLDDVYDDILKIRAMMGNHNYDIKRQLI